MEAGPNGGETGRELMCPPSPGNDLPEHRGTGSPRRDGVTYAGALRGEEETLPEQEVTLQGTVEKISELKHLEEVGWEDVRSKRQKKAAAAEKVAKTTRGEVNMDMGGFFRRPPPMLHTPEGPIQVCGQCLFPGHRAEVCRRDITCRHCGGVGHKAVKCKAERKDLGRLRGFVVERGAHRRRPSPLPEKLEEPQKINQRKPLPEKTVTPLEPHVYDVYLPLDSEMMKSKAYLRRCTVASVTMKEGMPLNRTTLSEELRRKLGDHWEWPSRAFRNGNFLVTCPSSEVARELEDGGALHFHRFSLSFRQWTPDMSAAGKAEGEKRWVLLRDVPLHCGHRDSVARLLEPIGELVYADDRSAGFVDDLRVAIRVRRGREIPSTIRASIGSRKHHIMVELARGEATLPWSKQKAEERPRTTMGSSLERDATEKRTNEGKGLWSREEKGKAPAEEPRPKKKARELRPPTGIVIHDTERCPVNRENGELGGGRFTSSSSSGRMMGHKPESSRGSSVLQGEGVAGGSQPAATKEPGAISGAGEGCSKGKAMDQGSVASKEPADKSRCWLGSSRASDEV